MQRYDAKGVAFYQNNFIQVECFKFQCFKKLLCYLLYCLPLFEKNHFIYTFSVLACSLSFTISNALQKFGHHDCAPWQLLIYRGVFQTAIMMLFRGISIARQILEQVSILNDQEQD